MPENCTACHFEFNSLKEGSREAALQSVTWKKFFRSCKKVHRMTAICLFVLKNGCRNSTVFSLQRDYMMNCFYNDDKHLLAFRIGPETLAGAEPHSGRLSLFIGYVMKRLTVNSSRVCFVPKSLPQSLP